MRTMTCCALAMLLTGWVCKSRLDAETDAPANVGPHDPKKPAAAAKSTDPDQATQSDPAERHEPTKPHGGRNYVLEISVAAEPDTLAKVAPYDAKKVAA